MMEEAVYARSGLLGLAILSLITCGPWLLNRMTAWYMRHMEANDRIDEKVTDAFIAELSGNRREREILWQEREQLSQITRALSAKMDLLDQRLSENTTAVRNHGVLLSDFDIRLTLFMQSKLK